MLIFELLRESHPEAHDMGMPLFDGVKFGHMVKMLSSSSTL